VTVKQAATASQPSCKRNSSHDENEGTKARGLGSLSRVITWFLSIRVNWFGRDRIFQKPCNSAGKIDEYSVEPKTSYEIINQIQNHNSIAFHSPWSWLLWDFARDRQ